MIQFATLQETTPTAEAALSDERLWEEIRRMADALLSTSGTEGAPEPVREIATGAGRFYARAVALDGTGRAPAGALLVAIEPSEPRLPTLFELQRSFDLTPREAEVAVLLAKRRSNREIAEELDITPFTARRHTEKVLLKLRVRRRTEVRRVLLEYGLAAAN